MHTGGFLPKVALITSLVVPVGCSRSGPTELPQEGGTVHVKATNGTTENLWFGYATITQVVPGGTVELTQCSFPLRYAKFAIQRSPSPASSVAGVEFAVRHVPTSISDELTTTLSVTSDASGHFQVASDRPDILEVIAVTPVS
jgi:hypothetical protein